MGVVIPTVVALICAAALAVFISPFPLLPAVVLVLWAFVLIGPVWLAFTVAQLVLYRWDRRVLVAPVMVVVTAALLAFQVPFHLGWWAMRGTMTAHAQECVNSHERQWIGVYSVERISGSAGSCHFRLTGGFLDTVGIAYLPGEAPRQGFTGREGVRGYEPLGDGWYRYREVF
ncbi:hypothetical protein [Tomitella fengzijianii]|uniref:Uncharacterized protein n=1 Tax=Tomitella fengzijianii TaxID=2597660 RepID=A0A516X341_9ACTN|nr:hypothetical protein [Tomitella fengzijianii]QDQ97496.1 hypothetical protein FO059_09355 [Tomitella fengzijianii]